VVLGVSSVIISYIFGGFSSAMLSAVTHLNVHMFNFLCNIPKSPQNNAIFQLFIDIGKFDFIPTDKFMDQIIFGLLPETSP
jgi:hypothetical protein